jgi:hypothetical protein
MAVKASRVRDTNYPQAHLPPVRYKLRRNSYTRPGVRECCKTNCSKTVWRPEVNVDEKITRVKKKVCDCALYVEVT